RAPGTRDTDARAPRGARPARPRRPLHPGGGRRPRRQRGQREDAPVPRATCTAGSAGDQRMTIEQNATMGEHPTARSLDVQLRDIRKQLPLRVLSPDDWAQWTTYGYVV